MTGVQTCALPIYYQAIFGLPQTATSGQLQMLLGLATLLAAWLMWTVRGNIA